MTTCFSIMNVELQCANFCTGRTLVPATCKHNYCYMFAPLCSLTMPLQSKMSSYHALLQHLCQGREKQTIEAPDFHFRHKKFNYMKCDCILLIYIWVTSIILMVHMQNRDADIHVCPNADRSSCKVAIKIVQAK